jgi:heptosyltransferase III
MNYWLSHFIDRYFGIFILLMLYPFKKTPQARQENEIKSILLIKFSLIGDTILLHPSIKAIKKHYPKSNITFLCSSINEEIVKNWAEVDSLQKISFKSLPETISALFCVVKELRKNNYDVVIDFEQWFRLTAIISFCIKAFRTIGFKAAGQYRHYLYTDTVKHEKKKHELLCFFDLIKVIGVAAEDTSIKLHVVEKARENGFKLLKSDGLTEGTQFAIIHPGAGKHGDRRAWEAGNYVQIADYIADKYKLKVILTGSKEDHKWAQDIADSTEQKSINIAGKTSLSEFIAIVENASLVICGNTGAMHIAASFDRPLVALHGPTDVVKWGPWSKNNVIVKANMDCQPCSSLGFEYGCRNNTCMTSISIDEVKSAVDKLLE